MQYWSGGFGACLLVLAALIFAGGLVASQIPRRFPVPRSMVAGLLGLALGPSFAGVLPVATEQLEAVVYHGLALVFIAMSLKPPPKSAKKSGDVLAIGLSIPAVTALQGVVGMVLILVWNLVRAGAGPELHPGFALMAPLGYSQGPGQALSLGSAWTELGFVDGAAIGLLMAGAGFLFCTFAGSVWLGTRPDLVGPADAEPSRSARGGIDADEAAEITSAGLVRSVFGVGLVYFFTWLILQAGDVLVLDGKPQLRAMVWGFHFLIGLGIALVVRTTWSRVTTRPGVEGPALGTVAGIVVEFTTAAALTAMSATVFARWWLPILLLCVLAGGITLVYCLVMERRGFSADPFHHAVLLFGTCTGTLLTGMALLRVIDPKLESPAASNQVLASAVAVPFALPLLMGVMPYAVSAWEPGSNLAAAVSLGLLALHATVMVGILAWHRRRKRDGSGTGA